MGSRKTPIFTPPKWMFKRENDDNMMIYHVFLRQAHAMSQDPTPVFTAQELWMLWTFICPWILQKAIHGRKETDNSRFRQQTETPQENATKPSSHGNGSTHVKTLAPSFGTRLVIAGAGWFPQSSPR